MITGIDETGDFRVNGNEWCYFVAVHLDQNSGRFREKQVLFNRWEDSIPENFKKRNGEVKASGLPETYLERFYFDFLEPEPKLRYSVVKVLPSKNPKSLQVKHQQLESEEFERTYKRLEKEGRTKQGVIYKNIFLWHKKLSYDKFLKLRCLYAILGLSFNQVFIWSQLRFLLDKYDDSNLKNMQFKIDKDFISSPHSRQVWNELFRHFWHEYTKEFKVPIISYPDGVSNPVDRYFRIQNGRLHIPDTFGKNTNFMDSNSHFELRIADIVAYVFHRYENRKRCQQIGKKLLDNITDKKAQYHELVLTTI